jgi:hypothetical protein
MHCFAYIEAFSLTFAHFPVLPYAKRKNVARKLTY